MLSGQVHRLRFLVGAVMLAATATFLPSSAQAASLSNSFTLGAEGWTTLRADTCSGPTPQSPTFNLASGNPGGYISAADNGSTSGSECYWAFVAPSTVSGDLRVNYGGTIAFDIKGFTTAPDLKAQVVVTSTLGDRLYWQSGAAPTLDTWSHFSVTLKETSAAWAYLPAGSSTPTSPTKSQFIAVLASAQDLQILGDLVSTGTAHEVTGLDNVTLTEPATPVDSDGDGEPDITDQCPSVPGSPANNGCSLANAPNPQACVDAVNALSQAKAKVRKLKKRDASKRRIRKAKAVVSRYRSIVFANC